ncbi:protein CHROMATIN REMODELING 24 isoform X2 [Setaria italica]|uniref:protein CHROMATIN REMODELING 24 isoform X2 n=1 Tax=Setaria italica TaxID=4555 RepID=UPI000BE5874E|nr:protein CHROMATIN REMODELING 24 isoform X2 [Setaria italica]
MASPPPFEICDDLDDDIDEPATAVPADRHHPAAAPTPNGLNDRLLRLARSRQDPNPNPNPIPPPEAAAAEEEGRKVKLAGRRRLCKLAATATHQLLQDEEEDHDDCESIRDIMDDLTTRLDSLSVRKPNPTARPTQQQLAPLPCAITADPDAEDGASSPLRISSSDDEATAITRRAELKPQPTSVASAFTDYACGAVRGKGKGKGTKDAGRINRVSKASSFVDSDSDSDYDDGDEGERTATAYAAKDVARKRRPPKASTFRNNDDSSDDGLGQEKENRGVVENDAEDVGWEKTEDFKMEPTGTAATSKPYKLPGRIFKMLYPHQREGLRWLWVLHCRGTGGILGDDMGLGKTMQVSAFLAGLFHSHLIKRVLIVAPKTLLAHWTKELSVVGLKQKIRDYSGPSTNIRSYELQYAFKEGGVLLTTYDIVRNNYKLIRGNSYNNDDDDEEGTLWNYVILDEGHLIKNNNTQRAKSLFEIPCAHRIVISGTPIQNNLKEMWALFNFCCPDVLGDKQQFKTRYESAILRGNDKSATAREKHVGSNVAKELRERIKPYFLRRMKSEVFLDSGASEEKTLAKKNELIVWLKLTPCQRKLYEAFLKSELVHLAIQPKGSPLAAITILKKICDHPLLLTKKAAEGVLEGMDEMLNDQDIGMVEKMAMNLADMAHDDNVLEVGQDVSCKLSFIMSLLRNLVKEGHHVLIFSQTRKMLNLIQEAILLEGYKFLRIDGTTKVSERERIVKDFQEGPGAPIFLLTTQVGGLGLTLTKATRVIVVDPAWNPSTDNQSVDRAYRIGQTKDVIVYRLMTSATIEEKIYKLQVFKGALFRTATEQKEQTRYFSKSEIHELFSLPQQGFDVSLTQKQLQEEHGQQVVMDESLRQHIQFLEQQGIAGVSHHSLMFSKTATLPTLSENDALDSKPRGMPMMPQHYYKGSSSDYVASGAAFALKPKDEKFTAPRYSPSNRHAESPEEIKVLVSKLPDGGEKIRRQISELDEKLTSAEKEKKDKATEVICLDDLSADMESNVLSV